MEKEFAITAGIGKNRGVVDRIYKELGLKAFTIDVDSQIAGAPGRCPLRPGTGENGPQEGLLISLSSRSVQAGRHLPLLVGVEGRGSKNMNHLLEMSHV